VVVIKKKLSNNNIINTFFEPVLNDSTPKWLVVKEKISYEVPDDKNIREIIKNPKDLETKKEIDVLPSGLWQCLKCGGQTQADKKPIHCPHCNRDSSFENITKIINQDLWKLPYWKDIPVENLDMLGLYDDTIKLLKRCLIFVEEIQYKIYVLWIFSSWKIESWESIGMPHFVGLIDSGKSRGLDYIRELGWRMVHGANATFPAMVRATHYFQAGVLLDEAQNKLNPRTEIGQQMLDFIKPGYRRGSKYLVADKEDQEAIISYDNFGFKAFAGETFLDKAMMSRCIIFEMEKDYPEVDKISEVEEELNHIQTMLLNYKYKTNQPPELPEDCPLKGRIREVYENIIRTGMHIGVNVDDVIEYATRAEKEQVEEFRNSIEWEILNVLRNQVCNETLDDAPETIQLKDIIESLGWDGKSKGQNSQSLGYRLRNLGIKTFHTRDGNAIKLVNPKTSRKLRYLYKRYGI